MAKKTKASDAVTIAVAELIGPALDYAVAKCLDLPELRWDGSRLTYNRLLHDGHLSMGQQMLAPWSPSTNWGQGGPLLEQERIWFGDNCLSGFEASKRIGIGVVSIGGRGPTPLIAVMRCFVESRLGSEVQIPALLLPGLKRAA